MTINVEKTSKTAIRDPKNSFTEYIITTKIGKAYLYHLNNSYSEEQPVLFVHGYNSSDKIWSSVNYKKKTYKG
ncbi:MAG: hypothetical protein ACFFD4_39425, partial [Candidatus Odinarchaeota archaeon]